MKKILFIFIIFVMTLNAKDFYYNFINSDKTQISEKRKKRILSANYQLNTIKRLVRENQLSKAYKKIVKFRKINKVRILNSTAILIYADILYKKNDSTLAREAVELLTKSVNNSKIQKEDLLEAYKLLVVLNLKINKPKEAKYYSDSIGRMFDNPLSKVFSKITSSQINMYQRQYRRAIKTLYKILVKTNNVDVATVVADELYDAYILASKDDKAYELAGKVLKKNIKYYANDSFLALRKVDKLLKANMPEFAIDILKMLLKNAVEPQSINQFKFRLANTYMDIAGQNMDYLLKAKELYKDLMAQKFKTPYYEQVKVVMDEILMREGKVSPSSIMQKYPASEAMEQKVMLQELLDMSRKKDYKTIQKMRRVYGSVSNTIAKRFGYKSIDEVFDIINANMIRFYLNNEQCIELSDVLHTVRDEALIVLVKDNRSRVQLFECLTQIPDKRSYEMARDTFETSKDPELYFSLEKIALLLDEGEDAYEFAQKLDMVDAPKIKEKEFLYRFLTYGKLNNQTSMEQFFRYTAKHPDYIEKNKNNPLIIDFYYQYYIYLRQLKNDKEAINILNTLNETQQRMGAFVYSPFVEFELTKESKLDDNHILALEYLDLAQKHTRSIKDNDLAQIFYEKAKLYETLGKKARYKKSIQECQDLKDANNFYKKMCDEL